MDTTVSQLKNEIASLVAQSQGIRHQINILKWTPEGLSTVKELRAKRVDGRRVHGRSDLKPFHRPETGPERYSLWNDKRSLKHEIRLKLLALAYLRGKPYAALEKKNAETKENLPSPYAIFHSATELLLPGTVSMVEAWIAGAESPKVSCEVAA